MSARRAKHQAPPASPGETALDDLVCILAEQAAEEYLAELASAQPAQHDRPSESEGRSTMAPQSFKKLIETLRSFMNSIGEPPEDPLNGATFLDYAPNMADYARDLARMYDRPFGRLIGTGINPSLPPGHILCRRGLEVVLIIGPEPPPKQPLGGMVRVDVP